MGRPILRAIAAKLVARATPFSVLTENNVRWDAWWPVRRTLTLAIVVAALIAAATAIGIRPLVVLRLENGL